MGKEEKAGNKEEKTRSREGETIGDIALEEQGRTKEDIEEKEEKQKPEVDSTKLQLEVEKLDGKIEMQSSMTEEVNSRISDMSERIGEIRSMVLEREKSFDRIDSNYEKIKDEFSVVDPNKIRKRFDKIKSDVEMNSISAEKLESILEEVKKELKDIDKKMGKLGNIESVTETYSYIKKQVNEIEQKRLTVNKLTSKVEIIFSEMSKLLPEFESIKEGHKEAQEGIKELVSLTDELSLKSDKSVNKEQLDSIKNKQEVALKTSNTLKTGQENNSKEIKDLKTKIGPELTKIKNQFSQISSSALENKKGISEFSKEIKYLKNKFIEEEDVTSIFQNYTKDINKELEKHEAQLKNLSKPANQTKMKENLPEKDLQEIWDYIKYLEDQIKMIKKH
ncbi:MAG: hypothetical protein KAU95_04710 [Candidatus Aenigmarchaeota archaeon]|nr:hypothetical protein [Candidatus Aenigmarchaeota archaeon]